MNMETSAPATLGDAAAAFGARMATETRVVDVGGHEIFAKRLVFQRRLIRSLGIFGVDLAWRLAIGHRLLKLIGSINWCFWRVTERSHARLLLGMSPLVAFRWLAGMLG